ncbi:MAG: hypothetical protein SFV51_21895 [Bryobacteraceae bacterium]|nr:hypothetical protein [Bryobacteraceae bacterium]
MNHDDGINLKGAAPEKTNHLGLTWTLEPARDGRLFVLATRNFHYQLQLAPGARFVLEYTKATSDDEPIRFICDNFSLGESGISLTAEVTDEPARLNGINTRFTFHGTRLEIVENQIQDFTLMGSGPLPPDLVGDATADISLQFQQKDNALALLAGAAELKGTNLLEAKATHFEFKVDALGLQFVDDAGYHLYFTVTGSATYSPEPFNEDDDPLHFLSTATIELVECPLTGDATVLARHINFLVEFNEPLEFKFLGAFTFELRAIGFLASTEEFDGDAAMQLTGQIMFSQEGKDTKSAKVDFHGLLIAAPRPGDLLPRLHLGTLAVEIEYGDAFHLSGEVEFTNNATEKGFSGEGILEIKGMPTIAASFSFLRVRLDEQSNWVLAWFIFVEVRKVSFKIPVVEIFLREVGLGFGYRYTLTSIATADKEKDLKKLIESLRELSRTAGDLSKRDRWAVDLEQPGEDPRWTIAFRALFSQTSASTPLKYNEASEKELPCVFLFDAVAAVRSDLTFFMAARGWINTNYNDFITAPKEAPLKPIVTGFVILSARQKRLLAHVASNPDGDLGERPKLPDFVKSAVKSSQFSATLLIEPGLFHLEMGWPNMLRWSQEFGPLKMEFRGGFIFRVTTQELVIGISFQARASLDIRAELSLVVVGARLEASMRAALGARLLAVTSLTRSDDVAVYAAVGVDVRIAIRLVIWIGFKLGFINLTKEFAFSLSVGFTAGLEIGIRNGFGIQGSGTISVEVMGHSLHFSASFAHEPGIVTAARNRTSPYLNIGLEATDVEEVPGIASTPVAPPPAPPVSPVAAPPAPKVTPVLPNSFVERSAAPPVSSEPRDGTFFQPGYVAFVMRKTDGPVFFLLMPQGEGERGFLPPPRPAAIENDPDFRLTLPGAIPGLQRFESTGFTAASTQTLSWNANWSAPLFTPEGSTDAVTLADYLKNAYLLDRPMTEGTDSKAVGDPEPMAAANPIEDPRVHNPTDSSFEAAVRGAFEQFRGSPMFRRDPKAEYDRALGNAFNPATTVYQPAGGSFTPADSEQAIHFRGAVVHDLVEDFRAFVTGKPLDTSRSIPFQLGLVFQLSGDLPAWLTSVIADPAAKPKMQQRGPAPNPAKGSVTTFNVATASFHQFPPRFERVRQYTSSNTIALAWDLEWATPPEANCTECQKLPEHHLMHYEVRRRALDGGEREVLYTVKNASVLNRKGDALQVLRPRFKVVDNFNEESLAEQAALPRQGRSYLYTITPYDVAGNPGRPLSLIATRYPDEPPAVPAGAELTVAYALSKAPQATGVDEPPRPFVPDSITVAWRDPVRSAGVLVPVAVRRLVFRRTATLPLGSYGLDAATSQPRRESLPTSNARPLPTDVSIVIDPDPVTDSREPRKARIPVDALIAAGVFPRDGWRPEAWSIFYQTESDNGVPSALAPVKVLLRFDKAEGGFEERHPGDLEFLPQPVRLPLLPPEDQHATTGLAHFPMPAGVFDGTLNTVTYRPHPEQTRAIRFRWNQGPSSQPAYPLALNAGFSILELNIDANTTQTFNRRDLLANALWEVQEVRMLPAADLLLAPNHTLATSQWEAWYPSTVTRAGGGWYSWRESQLEWPEWTNRTTALHPDLESIVANLREKFAVDLQVSPPMQATTLAGLLQSTAPGPDPYGWGILQRFGLCVALSLRDQAGKIQSGENLLAAIKDALPANNRFLHVELLFQPSRAVSLEPGAPPADSLLGVVQLSMRPAVRQDLKYFLVSVRGNPNQQFALTVTPQAACTLLNPLDPASGEISLTSLTPAVRAFKIPLSGEIQLLLRSRLAPTVVTPTDIVSEIRELLPTDRRTNLFTAPLESLKTDAAASGDANQWRRLKAYCESLNSNAPDGDKIILPVDEAGIEKELPGILAWTTRFFDHGGTVTGTQTGNGPFVATAYPRSTAQVFTSPDESGRLQHDYLITDKFAHNFRYYIRPFGRYDLLWQSLLQSPPRRATPDPAQGALDVVLDRTQPVAMPVVLRSGRLDAPSAPGSPAAPGDTWEVIVARHPEQALADRNQTVFRQLSYRGITFTLLRKFAFPHWAEVLNTSAGTVAGVTPSLPAAPTALDHIDPNNQSITLDLAPRLGSFDQGAIVLQWSALPFYYEHRLLLVAQTATTVSEVNSIVQRDFEYISPDPEGRAQGIVAAGGRLRRLTIPLKRLWDSLPAQAQAQWQAEEPDASLPAKPGAVPDLDVVYQIVYSGNGNVEVQSELFFEGQSFQSRQLGQAFTVAGNVSLSAGFEIAVSLLQTTKVSLRHVYTLDEIPLPTRASVSIADGGHVLSIKGVLRPDDVIRILLPEFARSAAGLAQPLAPPQEIGAFTAWQLFFLEFYATRQTGQAFQLGPLSAKLDFPLQTPRSEIPAILVDQLTLSPGGEAVWKGTITARQLAALQEFAVRLPSHRIHQQAISALVGRHQSHSEDLSFPYPITRPRVNAELPASLQGSLTINSTWLLTWSGVMSDAQIEALRAINADRPFRVAIGRLIGNRQNPALPPSPASLTASLPLNEPVRRPLQAELPESVRGSLTLTSDWTLNWNGEMSEEQRLALQRLPGDEPFLTAILGLIQDRLPKTVPFPAPAPVVTKDDLRDIFTEEEIEPIEIPAGTGIVFKWRQHQPLPLPSRIYRDRVDEKFASTNPRFVEAFNRLMDRLQQAISELGPTSSGPSAPPPVLLRCRAPLSDAEARQLRNLSGGDPGVEALIRDVDDRRLLEEISNDWFSSVPISAPAPVNVEHVDFPEPRQCTLVWTGEMSDAERAQLRSLFADPGFNNAIEELIDSEGSIRIAHAPLGLDQPPGALRGKIAIQASGANHTALEWTGPDMLDSDVAALLQWAPLEALIEIDALDQSEFTAGMAAENTAAIPKPRPRPIQSQLPAALQSKLTIEPLRLIWKGRLSDHSQLAMLEDLKGDDAFHQAIERVIAHLKTKPIVAFPTPVPQRPQQSSLPAALKGKLLIGRAVIRHHGLMTAEEGRALRAAYTEEPDKAAIQRLFDSSVNRGLAGGELAIRTRRGSAAPSRRIALRGESIQ